MKIIQSDIFRNFPEIVFGFSTKIGLHRESPFLFNMSYSVGDNPENVSENRAAFANYMGLRLESIVFQKQIHSDIIKVVNEPGIIDACDALITAKENLGLAVSSADCAAIFIYDFKLKIIAAIHSGWRGTQKKIVEKTLNKMKSEFFISPENLAVYIAPSISERNYEVGEEIAELFDSEYLTVNGNKYLLDISGVNRDMLLKFGIPDFQIEISNLCSYENNNLLHSYRRDGKISGRALGIISMMEY